MISQDVDWTWIFFVFISFPFLTGVLLIPRPRHSGEIWILDVYRTLDSYPVYVNCDWKIYRYTPTLLCVDHAKWWIWKQLGFSNLRTETVLCILCTILPKQNLNMFSLFSDYNVRDFHLSSIGIRLYLYGFIIDSHKLHFLSYCVKLYNAIKYLCHTKMIKKRFLKNHQTYWLSSFNITCTCIRSAELYCLYVTFAIFMPQFVKRGETVLHLFVGL
mgnify:CR=1 FL=1